jgi:hypothetical protein
MQVTCARRWLQRPVQDTGHSMCTDTSFGSRPPLGEGDFVAISDWILYGNVGINPLSVMPSHQNQGVALVVRIRKVCLRQYLLNSPRIDCRGHLRYFECTFGEATQ